MKNLCFLLLIFFAISCENENNSPETISVNNIKLSECLSEAQNSISFNTTNTNVIKGYSCLFLQAVNNRFLYIDHQHTMSSCGTEEIEIEANIKNDTIYIKEIDKGPFAWCYCWRNIEFELGPLKEKEYTLHLIGCDTSYNRDTIILGFKYSPDLYLNNCN